MLLSQCWMTGCVAMEMNTHPGWVHVVPPGACSPFAPIAPDSGPSFCRAAPKSPMVGRRTPLPHPSSFSPQPTAMGGVRPGCEENHERSRKV